MKKYQLVLISMVVLLMTAQIGLAADNAVAIIAEGTYIMGDGETAWPLSNGRLITPSGLRLSKPVFMLSLIHRRRTCN